MVAKERARELRLNMTDAERRLWALLRRKKLAGYRFRRQAPIGPYYADFFCPNARLVIEVDGTFHGDKCQYPDRVVDAIYGELTAPFRRARPLTRSAVGAPPSPTRGGRGDNC